MRFKLGDLVEVTEDFEPILGGGFKAGEKLYIASTGNIWIGPRYRVRAWHADKASRDADKRTVTLEKKRASYPFKVIGCAFEAPEKMADWVGRTVKIQSDIYVGKKEPRKVFAAGDRAVVSGHYRGRLYLGYCPDDPRRKDARYVASGVGRTIYDVLLEPL